MTAPPLEPCGTYGAYQRHIRRGEEPCGPCRRANAAYLNAYRERRPEAVNADKQRERARQRAFARLREIYPDLCEALINEELRKIRQREAS